MPCVTLFIFVLGVAYRLHRWNHARGTRMPLFPAPSGRFGKWGRIAWETLTFNSLKKTDRPLWLGTTIFHAALLLVLAGHLRTVAVFSTLGNITGLDKKGFDALAGWLGSFLGLVLLAAGIFLLIRRISLRRVRTVSSFEDYATIVLILAVTFTGDLMRFVSHFDPALCRQMFSDLVRFQQPAIPSDAFFLFHFFLGQLLVMYIPFSKFLHIPGVFYSKSILYQQ